MLSEVGIDWLQLTAPEELEKHVFGACMEAAGGEAPKVGKGRRPPGGEAFERGCYWASGVELHSGGRRPWLIVPGAACTQLGFSSVRLLGRACMLGGTCTRLDVRRDLKGDDVPLVRDVEAACEARQLRRLRQYTTYPIKSADGDILGRGVLLGSYASPKFVRVYDKGLETGTAGEGKWVRFEVQLRSEMAHQAAVSIFGAETEHESSRAALAVLHGIVDFRDGPRESEPLRLPRPEWWRSFVGDDEGVRLAEVSLPPDLERWRRSLQVQYLGVLVEAARRAGVSLPAAMAWAADGACPTAGTMDNPVVGLIAAALSRTVDGGS